jgi:hypothetical protein
MQYMILMNTLPYSVTTQQEVDFTMKEVWDCIVRVHWSCHMLCEEEIASFIVLEWSAESSIEAIAQGQLGMKFML